MSKLFEAGVSAVEISPDAEWFRLRRQADGASAIGGYTRASFTDGVAEPVWVRTLVTRGAGRLMVLITADLTGIRQSLLDRVRGMVADDPALAGAKVAMTASHTHSGSPYEDDALGLQLAERMMESVAAAMADLAPARVGATFGYCGHLSYYERIPITAENAERLGAGPQNIGGIKHSRDYIESRMAAGPIDPQVGVVRIDRADGTPRAVLVHFAAHPAIEIEPPHVSPDYVGFMVNKVQREMPGVVALFCQGADGAVNINNLFGTLDHARRHGEELADEVLRVAPTIETTADVECGWAAGEFETGFAAIPSAQQLDAEIAMCRDYIERLAKDPSEVWLGQGPYTVNLPPAYPPAARCRMAEAKIEWLETVRPNCGRKYPPVGAELQMFRWNDVALVFNTFELFVELGLEVKRLSPYRYTLPVGYSGQPGGYIAPAEQIARGGYHFNLHSTGRFDPANGDRLVAGMLDLLKQ